MIAEKEERFGPFNSQPHRRFGHGSVRFDQVECGMVGQRPGTPRPGEEALRHPRSRMAAGSAKILDSSAAKNRAKTRHGLRYIDVPFQDDQYHVTFRIQGVGIFLDGVSVFDGITEPSPSTGSSPARKVNRDPVGGSDVSVSQAVMLTQFHDFGRIRVLDRQSAHGLLGRMG